MYMDPDCRLFDELKKIAKDYVKPYMTEQMAILDTGYIVISDDARCYGYDWHYNSYDMLMSTIRYTMTCFKHGKNPLESCDEWLYLLNQNRNSRDYSIILRIIFFLIKNKVFSKSAIVKVIAETENIPALTELIRYDEFNMDEKFDL